MDPGPKGGGVMSAPAIRQTAEVLRDLPINIDNEKNLIWCLLRKPELLRDESLSFSVEDFHFTPHKRIVQAIIDLDNERESFRTQGWSRTGWEIRQTGNICWI